MSTPFRKSDLILFTGDSVTDCNRDRTNPDSLGTGYADLVVRRLRLEHADLNLRFRNTGISGDRTCDLQSRWETDCVALQPQWVSLLVGVNNTWRRYDSNDPTPDDIFEQEYRRLLQRITNETSANLILCSPFLLHVDASVKGMREDLDPKITIIQRLAVEFNARWVDFDAAFAAAQLRHIPEYWAEDGVHPSEAGHALMADTWINSVDG